MSDDNSNPVVAAIKEVEARLLDTVRARQAAVVAEATAASYGGGHSSLVSEVFVVTT